MRPLPLTVALKWAERLTDQENDRVRDMQSERRR